jgi:hypothetical protein
LSHYLTEFLNSYPLALQAFMEAPLFSTASLLDEQPPPQLNSNDVGYTLMLYADAAACKEADKWRASIHKEVRELLRQGTFKVVD